MKAIFSNFLRVSISAALLVYLFRQIDIHKTIEVVRSAQLSYIGLAALVYVIIFIFLLWRWVTFIHALNLNASLKNIVRYYFIGLFGNLFLPSSIGGDVIKIIGLCKDCPEKAKVVASVVLDRLSGFAGIVTVALCAFIFGYSYINDFSLLVSILILAAGSLLIITFLFNETMYSFACKIFDRLPKIKKSLMSMHYDIALLKGRKMDGFKAIGISCLAQIVLSVSFYFIARALHQNIPFIYFLIFIPLVCVASSVPSIGGLGVREAGAAYLFAKIGIDSGVAISMSLINFTFTVIIGLLGGVVYVATISSGRVQHLASNPPRP